MDASKYNPVYDFFRDIYYKRTGQDIPIHTLPYNTTSTTGITGSYSGVTVGYIPHGIGAIGSTGSYGITGSTGSYGITGSTAPHFHGNCGDPYCQSCSDLRHRVLTTGFNTTNIVTVGV